MRRVVRWSRRLLALCVLLLAVASLLPLLETNAWWVRILDFPRLQIAAALALVLALLFLIGAGRRSRFALVIGLVALVYQAYRLYPYAPIFAPTALAAETCGPASRLRVMVANVQRQNRDDDVLLAAVSSVAPDLLVVLETNAWWDRALAPLDAGFPNRVQEIPEDATFYGMHLFSRLPLLEPEVRFGFGEETPAIETGVRLDDGGIVRLHALHPRPPHRFSQPSTMRDATLLAAALDAGASSAPTILAGDFNAVPWERVNRRALRLGGLLDPRVGRGPLPTFTAGAPFLVWPLDQVLYAPAFTLLGLERLPRFGSDHRPFVATLCHDPEAAPHQPPPAPAPDDAAEAAASIEAARAASGLAGAAALR